MTAREMQIEFERLVQLANPSLILQGKLDSDTIFSILNMAQIRYILLSFTQGDQLTNATQNIKRNLDSFKGLIINVLLSNIDDEPVDLTPTQRRYKLPSDYLLYVHSESIVTGTVNSYTESDRLINQLISHNQLEEATTTAYNTPILYTPAVILEGNTSDKTPSITVYYDVYTKLQDVDLTYIRTPKEINTIVKDNAKQGDCELSEDTHMDIVKLAVDIFTSEKYKLMQRKPATKNTNEQ